MLNKLRKGQVTIFGKTISVLAAVLTLTLLSGVGLALLTAYITITGTATVGQSVVLTDCQLYEDGSDVCTGESHNPEVAIFAVDVYGGNTRDVGIKIKNNADIDANFDLESTAVSGATISYYGGYNEVDHECDTSGGTISNPITIGSGVEQFYCVRYVWNIAANPITGESITITVSPA
jgi:hypothetical protein